LAIASCRSGTTHRSHVVGDLGAPEEPQGLPDPLERHGSDLGAVVLLRERQQEVIGRFAELLPIELQVRRGMEDRAGRVHIDELGPTAPVEITPVLGEGDPHRRPCYEPEGPP
jgi:hypothetical protein